MKQSNFSPVVMLILGVVPFLLMLVQWGAEDIVGMGRAIDYMTRWEVVFQIGLEMFLLGVILGCLDWLKEFIRIRKWRRDFISEWQAGYKEKAEEAARSEHFRREVEKINRNMFKSEYFCQLPFDEDTQRWLDKNNIVLRWKN